MEDAQAQSGASEPPSLERRDSSICLRQEAS